MNNLKTIVLTIAMLALLAANAAAQCGGKTVYLKLSEGWGESIYIWWEGNFVPITGSTKQGDWTIFNLPTGLSNDAAARAQIIFTNKASNYDAAGIHYITRVAIGSTQEPPKTNEFLCSDFGANGTWIMENLQIPGRTHITNDPPDVYYFYFLPPPTSEWALGTPVLAWNDPDVGLQKKKFAIDTLCGWYKLTYFNEPLPNGDAWIWLEGYENGARRTIDQVGVYGLDEDPMDWVDGAPTPFNLATQFGGSPGNLYFDAATGGWTTTRPNKEGTCSYKFAALIYDTDMSVHPDFSCGEYAQGTNAGNGADTKATCTLGAPYSSVPAYTSGGNLKGSCTGVRKGVVKPTLNPATRKIEYNASGDQWGCWTSEDWFNKAFNPSPGTNVVRCYDMPFKRAANGRYEFDSDKLLNANGQIVGGFFPIELTHREGADYSQCPNCDAQRPAESFAPLVKSIPADVFDSYASKNGDFANGDTPTKGTVLGTTATGSVWNWADANEGQTRNEVEWYLHGDTAYKGTEMAPVNSFFCFESHADFIYNPEQEFYFRGNDDIWIYINNQLVVDLGGTHLAAPGHVKLKNITPALVEGERYPMDIFFCNRRTTMSNLRISANMYFSKQSALSLSDGNQLSEGGAQVCLNTSSSPGSCEDFFGNISGGKKCGKDMGPMLDYYMLNRMGDRVELDNGQNTNCVTVDGGIKCYGGITLAGYPSVDRVIVRAPSMSGLMGTYTVYAKVKDPTAYPSATPIKITQFSIWAEEVPIITRAPVISNNQEPKYYNLKGEPLGSKKPSKAGAYVVRQGGVSRIMVVR